LETSSMTKPEKKPPTMTETIREMIRARGLTTYRVGKSAGMTPTVVARFLSGERDLKGATLDKLAAALGLALVETETGHTDLKATP
jgi:transcriptional regulator with XRE-family HTH domain